MTLSTTKKMEITAAFSDFKKLSDQLQREVWGAESRQKRKWDENEYTRWKAWGLVEGEVWAVWLIKKQNYQFRPLAQSADCLAWKFSMCLSSSLLLLLRVVSDLGILTASPLPRWLLERNGFWNLTEAMLLRALLITRRSGVERSWSAWKIICTLRKEESSST